MGIVVACAPTLKRLFGSWLNLGTTQKGSNYGYGGHSATPGGGHHGGSSYLSRNRDGAGGGLGVNSSPGYQNRDHSGYIKTDDDRGSDLDLPEREQHEMNSYMRRQNHNDVYLGGDGHGVGVGVAVGETKNSVLVTTSTWSPGTRTGSEEHILQQNSGPGGVGGGIVRTMEVRVHPN